MDVKSKAGRDELRKLFAYPSSTDNNAHHARGMLYYIDTLEAERDKLKTDNFYLNQGQEKLADEVRRLRAELQRRSFAFGNANLANPNVTEATVAQAARDLAVAEAVWEACVAAFRDSDRAGWFVERFIAPVKALNLPAIIAGVKT